MSHETRRDELLLYAAGALDEPEKAGVEAHLRDGCACCEAELSAAEALLLELALSPAPVDPSPAVKARLLERVRQSSQARVASAANARFAPARRRLFAAAGLAAMLAATLAGALVDRFAAAPLRARADALEASVRSLGQELGALADERDELRAQLTEQDEELAALEHTVETSAELIRFLRSPDLHSVALVATASQPDARVRVYWAWDDYTCHLHADGLRPPAPEHVYALWIDTQDGGTVRVGDFVPGPGGEGTLFARLPRDTGRVVRASVTEEARNAGERPSGALQLAAPVVDPRP
ncbi:MAG TPA: anti-sigma factor [Myxococcota bacterium]|nr:anti-sigma factor [Myxococcota bacterium]